MERFRNHAWLGAAAAFGMLYSIHLGSPELTPIDESRSGMIVRACLEGEWLRPRTPDGHLSEKPPLYYWTAAGVSWLFGEGEIALRGVSVFFALGTLVLVGGVAAAVSSPRAAVPAVAALGSNLLFAAWARTAMVDMAFTFFLTAGLSAYLAARLAKLGSWKAAGLAGFAFGLAVLAKGPLGIAIPAAVTLLDAAITTRGRIWAALADAAPVALALLLASLIAMTWYLPGLVAGGTEFLHTSLLDENVFMPLGLSHGIAGSHAKPPWYYPSRQLMVLLPMAALLPEAIRGVARRETGREGTVLLMWVAGGLAVLMAAVNKRWYYLLPLQPAMALLVAVSVAPATARPASRSLRWGVRIAGAVVAAGSLAMSLLAFCAPAPQMTADQRHWLELLRENQGWIALYAAALSWSGFVMLGSSFGTPAAMIRSVIVTAFLAAGVRSIVIDPIQGNFDRVRPAVSEMAALVKPGERVAAWPPGYGYGFDFYWPQLERGDAAAASAKYLLVRQVQLSSLPFPVEVLRVAEFSSKERHMALVRRLD